MITLQSTFGYVDGEVPPVASAQITFYHPVYNVKVIDSTTGEAVLDIIDEDAKTKWIALNQKKYLTSVDTSDLFGQNYGDDLVAYVNWLWKRDASKPKVADFTIPFQVGYYGETQRTVSFEAIWWHNALNIRGREKSLLTSSSPTMSDINPTEDPASSPFENVSLLNESSPTLSDINNPAEDPTSSLFENVSKLLAAQTPETNDALDKGIFVVNRSVYYEFLHKLFPDLPAESESILLYVIGAMIDLTGKSPTLSRGNEDFQQQRILQFLKFYGLPTNDEVYNYVSRNFMKLVDFPVKMTPVPLLSLAGNIHSQPLASGDIPKLNFNFYHLSIEFPAYDFQGDEVPQYHVINLLWDTTSVITDTRVDFAFSQKYARSRVTGPVVVRVKAFDGSELYSQGFDVNDGLLQKLDIAVPALSPSTIEPGDDSNGRTNKKKLRGKVVSLSKSCTLKGTIVINAMAKADTPWITVSTGTSDKDGNFTLPYPYGDYVDAQALVSMSADSITKIQIIPGNVGETISSDFLFIVLQKTEGGSGAASDCNCNPTTTAGRLPSNDDLMQSNQFSQDIGGTCTNLTVPNRTLREFNYQAVVRHTDPDVAKYRVVSETTSSSTEPFPKTVYRLELDKGGKLERSEIDLSNPIKWQDVSEDDADLELYQSVTVATGHVLHYKSEFKADGYSLGDLIYSLPLAPGQKKQIVTIDSSHSLLGSETQVLSQSEALAANLINERNIVDRIAGNIGESLAGSSSASTSGVSAGLGAAGSTGMLGASLGVAGGYSKSSSSASQQGSRALSQFFSETLRQAIQQNSSSYRQLNATAVTAVQEGQQYRAETDVVANHNHCHSMTMMYFEVLRHFAVFQELVDVEECIFVPLLMTRFALENIAKWADALAPRLLPLHSNTFITPALFSVLRGPQRHPLLPAFDAVERVRTDWKTVDYPEGAYCDEPIEFIEGQLEILVSIPRPNTRYDNILSLPVTTKEITRRVPNPRKAVKDIAIGILSGGLFGGDGTVKEIDIIETRAKVFDQFLTLDENYDSVPPSRCIRIRSFEPIKPVDNQVFDPVDNFFDLEKDTFETWLDYALLCGFPRNKGGLKDFLAKNFQNQLIGDWDFLWYKNIVPVIFTALLRSIQCSPFAIDTAELQHFSSAGQRLVPVSFSGPAHIVRKTVTEVMLFSEHPAARNLSKGQMIFILKSLYVNYSTAHYNGVLFRGSPLGDLLDATGAKFRTPLTAAERQNPRLDDKFLTQRLITHLNQNLEYYNRVLWTSLDSNRRFMLLDGFKIETFNKFGVHDGYRSLASVVKNTLLGVVGNSLVFPVAPGYHVGQTFIVATNSDGESQSESLLDHYRPIDPSPPYRLSVPVRGTFSEAIMGSCDSCEKVKPDSSQDWTKFTTDEPSAINPVVPVEPTITDWRAAFKDFATSLVTIQNAPAAPDPGAGLRAVTELLGKADIFRDVTGLDQTQKNALQTYLSNQENVKALASMASGMVTQTHNTTNSSKLMDSMKQAKTEGALDDSDYKSLVKSHFQQQIDGGTSLKADLDEKKKKPTLSDAAVAAAAKGDKNVAASVVDASGHTETLSVTGTGSGASKPTKTIVEIKGVIPLQMPKTMACWATTLTIVWRWKEKLDTLQIEDVLNTASDAPKWLKIYNDNTGLPFTEIPAFMTAYKLGSVPGPTNLKIETYIQWMNDYGPLMITLNSGGVMGHSWVLTKIQSDEPPPGQDTQYWMTIINPALAGEDAIKTVTFVEFAKSIEDLFRIFPSTDLFQVLHLKDKRSSP